MAGQTVVVSVLADTKKFTQGFKEVSSGSFISGITNGFRRIGSAVEKAMLAGIVAVTALGSLLAGIAIKGGITRLLDIEDAQAKLRGLGHDTKTVDQVMTDALASVKGTAFGLGEAATIAASAIASGVQPGKDLERTLKLVADTATIAGTDMGEMGHIFNKVSASNRLTMMEVNQLATRGVPILQWLADQYGVTAEEASKMVSQGKVDFEDFRAAIEENISGAALEGGNTTRGAFRNMQAALHRVGANLLGGVFPLFVEFFKGIIGWLEPVEAKAAEVGEAFGEWARDQIPRLKAAIDNRLIPAWRTVSGFFTDTLIPAMQRVRDWFREHRDEIRRVGDALGPAAGIVAALSTAFLWLSRAFRIIRLLTPVGLILALATALTYAWQNSETFRDILTNAWEAISRVVKSVWDNVLRPTLQRLGEMWDELAPRIEEIGGRILEVFDRIFGDIASGLSDNEGAWQGWESAIDTVVSIVETTLHLLLDIIETVLGHIETFWDRHGDTVVKLVQDAWRYIEQTFKNWGDIIHGILKIALGILRGDWDTFWDGVKLLARGAWNQLMNIFRLAADGLKRLLEMAWNDIKAKLRQRWNEILEFVKGIPGQIIGFFSALPGVLLQIGQNAASSFLSGLRSGLGDLRGVVGAAVRSIPGVGGGIANILGLQHGGPAQAGRPYIVGEAGPELFVPHGSGTVVPNHELGGDVTVNVALSRDAIAGIAQVEISRGNRLLKRQVLAGAGVAA